jgi:hypothetical protein
MPPATSPASRSRPTSASPPTSGSRARAVLPGLNVLSGTAHRFKGPSRCLYQQRLPLFFGICFAGIDRLLLIGRGSRSDPQRPFHGHRERQRLTRHLQDFHLNRLEPF